MTIPYYINGHQSEIRAIKPGWYGVENNGKLSSGPYPNQAKCLTAITQARGNFGAAPWLARAPAGEAVMGSAYAPKAKRDYGDKTRIDMNQSYQVAYWKERFGVTEQELSEAVRAAGAMARKVETYLNLTTNSAERH
jgi:Protein of unknown function (DUF3606)